MEEDIKTAIAILREWAKINLVCNNYPSPVGMVSITMGGIKETLNQHHRYQVEKIDAIYSIAQLLAEGEFVKTSTDKMGRPLIWHYLRIVIAGNNSYIVIREDKKSGNKILYPIVDYIK